MFGRYCEGLSRHFEQISFEMQTHLVHCDLFKTEPSAKVKLDSTRVSQLLSLEPLHLPSTANPPLMLDGCHGFQPIARVATRQQPSVASRVTCLPHSRSSRMMFGLVLSQRVVDEPVARFFSSSATFTGSLFRHSGCERIPAFQTLSLRMGSRPARKPTTSLSSKFLFLVAFYVAALVPQTFQKRGAVRTETRSSARAVDLRAGSVSCAATGVHKPGEPDPCLCFSNQRYGKVPEPESLTSVLHNTAEEAHSWKCTDVQGH